MLKKFLHSPDPADGGNGPSPVTGADNPPGAPLLVETALPSTAQTTAQPAAPPPAATTVVNGTKTERELALEAELEGERKKVRDRELRVSELEASVQDLTQQPQPVKVKSGKVRAFGLNFGDE